MPSSLLVRGGTVIDPSQGINAPLDILVEAGRITAVEASIAASRADRIVEATGLVVAPGFIDLHTHLREPGGEGSETIKTGALSAAAGGFTTIYCMPNTTPPCDSAVVIRYILDRSAEACGVRILPVAAVTRGQQGEELSDFHALRAAGAAAFSDDGRPVANAEMMRRALENTGDLGVVVFDHCEDMSLTGEGVMHEGIVALRLGLKGITRLSESTCIARDAALAELTGARLHVCHVSNVRSVERLREAKKRGAPVTAEVTPHHLTLTDVAVAGYNTNAKMKPPLCEDEDRQALIEALEDGTIDAIATDHAPHSAASKDTTFDAAPYGVIGMETAFAVLYTEFVEPGRWTLDFLIEKLTGAPARVMGTDLGTLTVGAPADMALLDPGRRWTLTPTDLRSRSRNCPWLGRPFTARVVGTIAGGTPVFAERMHSPEGLIGRGGAAPDPRPETRVLRVELRTGV